MKSETIKLFNQFISRNFFGYSAHTLYQISAIHIRQK